MNRIEAEASIFALLKNIKDVLLEFDDDSTYLTMFMIKDENNESWGISANNNHFRDDAKPQIDFYMKIKGDGNE